MIGRTVSTLFMVLLISVILGLILLASTGAVYTVWQEYEGATSHNKGVFGILVLFFCLIAALVTIWGYWTDRHDHKQKEEMEREELIYKIKTQQPLTDDELDELIG